MRAPTPAALLNAWEHGLSQPPARRALVLLALAYPEKSYDELLRLRVGDVDARLLWLREQLFGSHLHGVSSCPHCHEKIEMDFQTGDIRANAPAEPTIDSFQVTAQEHTVTFRLPNALDLEVASTATDASAARRSLLRRCVSAATTTTGSVEADLLPASVAEAVGEAMSQVDPQAASEIALACPACQHRWSVPFDIGSFLWTEIQTWAQQLLRDIHTLALAYGWSEAEVVALSPARRRAYLDLVQS